ncbi:hypothetical protein HPB52_015781 [Rhipicephalus sanguineus]|uniref:Uncharacterized protein n=1 Tax=Rhipicephalus sanguineus TaxID=34632 RepID=A0A9D4TAS7_RHISA|nr:hypothetical protein HPB52_015781 [Rhipicephalus sanguineus]
MLGQSQTALLHFEGPQLPQLVYFYGGEMPCRCYQPTRQFCPICRTPGHRPDVCPNPMARACDVCNLSNPEAGHTCVPKCALCGGPHLTAAKECENKLKCIQTWRKPATTEPPSAHRSPPASSSRSKSRSCLQPRPQSQSPKRRSRSMPQHQRQAATTAAPDDNGFSQHQQNREASPTGIDANKDRKPQETVPHQAITDLQHQFEAIRTQMQAFMDDIRTPQLGQLTKTALDGTQAAVAEIEAPKDSTAKDKTHHTELRNRL